MEICYGIGRKGKIMMEENKDLKELSDVILDRFSQEKNFSCGVNLKTSGGKTYSLAQICYKIITGDVRPEMKNKNIIILNQTHNLINSFEKDLKKVFDEQNGSGYYEKNIKYKKVKKCLAKVDVLKLIFNADYRNSTDLNCSEDEKKIYGECFKSIEYLTFACDDCLITQYSKENKDEFEINELCQDLENYYEDELKAEHIDTFVSKISKKCEGLFKKYNDLDEKTKIHIENIERVLTNRYYYIFNTNVQNNIVLCTYKSFECPWSLYDNATRKSQISHTPLDIYGWKSKAKYLKRKNFCMLIDESDSYICDLNDFQISQEIQYATTLVRIVKTFSNRFNKKVSFEDFCLMLRDRDNIPYTSINNFENEELYNKIVSDLEIFLNEYKLQIPNHTAYFKIKTDDIGDNIYTPNWLMSLNIYPNETGGRFYTVHNEYDSVNDKIVHGGDDLNEVCKNLEPGQSIKYFSRMADDLELIASDIGKLFKQFKALIEVEEEEKKIQYGKPYSYIYKVYFDEYHEETQRYIENLVLNPQEVTNFNCNLWCDFIDTKNSDYDTKHYKLPVDPEYIIRDLLESIPTCLLSATLCFKNISRNINIDKLEDLLGYNLIIKDQEYKQRQFPNNYKEPTFHWHILKSNTFDGTKEMPIIDVLFETKERILKENKPNSKYPEIILCISDKDYKKTIEKYLIKKEKLEPLIYYSAKETKENNWLAVKQRFIDESYKNGFGIIVATKASVGRGLTLEQEFGMDIRNVLILSFSYIYPTSKNNYCNNDRELLEYAYIYNRVYKSLPTTMAKRAFKNKMFVISKDFKKTNILNLTNPPHTTDYIWNLFVGLYQNISRVARLSEYKNKNRNDFHLYIPFDMYEKKFNKSSSKNINSDSYEGCVVDVINEIKKESISSAFRSLLNDWGNAYNEYIKIKQEIKKDDAEIIRESDNLGNVLSQSLSKSENKFIGENTLLQTIINNYKFDSDALLYQQKYTKIRELPICKENNKNPFTFPLYHQKYKLFDKRFSFNQFGEFSKNNMTYYHKDGKLYNDMMENYNKEYKLLCKIKHEDYKYDELIAREKKCEYFISPNILNNYLIPHIEEEILYELLDNYLKKNSNSEWKVLKDLPEPELYEEADLFLTCNNKFKTVFIDVKKYKNIEDIEKIKYEIEDPKSPKRTRISRNGYDIDFKKQYCFAQFIENPLIHSENSINGIVKMVNDDFIINDAEINRFIEKIIKGEKQAND